MEKTGIEKYAWVLILLAGTAWGIIGFFSSHLASMGFHSVEITFLRNFTAALFLWIYLLVFDRKKCRIKLKDSWMFLGTGILSIVFFNIMYFLTIELTTLSMAAILLYTAPCFVMVMSVVLFHEKMTKKKMLALFLALAGCLFTTGVAEGIVNGKFGGISKIGILTGIASGLGYALYSIFGNIALKKYHSMTVTAYTFMAAALFLMPIVVREGFLKRLTAAEAVGNSLGISIVSTLLPFLLYTKGLKYTEPGRASVLAFAEPMVATLIGIFVFKEPVTYAGIAGIVMIFGSVFLMRK